MTDRVRRRTADDLPAGAALLARVQEVTGYPIRWPADPPAWLDPPGTLAAWVAHPDSTDGDTAVLGHVCVSRRGAGAVLERLFVDPSRGRRGTGRLLVATALKWTADRGLPLALDVTDRPGPLAFYAALGWRETGRTPIDWGEGMATCLVHLEHD